MSESLQVGPFIMGAALVFALGLILLARVIDRLRGISPEESKTMGLMSTRGAHPASFGDLRDLPGEEPLESPYTIDCKPGAKVE